MAEDEQTVFSISRTAQMLPVRARGDTRLYSHQDIARLRLILHLTRDIGVNLAGVEIILRMQHQLELLQDEIEHLRQLLVAHGQQHGAERVQTQALIKATPRKLVKVK